MQPPFCSRAISLLRRTEVKLSTAKCRSFTYLKSPESCSLVLWVNLYTEQQGKASENINNLLNTHTVLYIENMHMQWKFLLCFNAKSLEKEMATHSSVLTWRIPGTGEPGGLLSMGSHRVGHDWSDLAAATMLRVGHDWVTSLSLFTFMHWRSKWQPTPVFLPGESQGRRSLVGCHLWGWTESDTTEVT